MYAVANLRFVKIHPVSVLDGSASLLRKSLTRSGSVKVFLGQLAHRESWIRDVIVRLLWLRIARDVDPLAAIFSEYKRVCWLASR